MASNEHTIGVFVGVDVGIAVGVFVGVDVGTGVGVVVGVGVGVVGICTLIGLISLKTHPPSLTFEGTAFI